jgi:hypothetical protein
VATTVFDDEAAAGADVPDALVADTSMIYITPDNNPSTTSGEDGPETVLIGCADDAAAVIVKEVAGGEEGSREKETDAAPSLYGRLVPTSVMLVICGVSGSRKSFCEEDFPPASFFAIISYSLLTFIACSG